MPRVGGEKRKGRREGGRRTKRRRRRNGTVKAAVLISRNERGIANESRLKERGGSAGGGRDTWRVQIFPAFDRNYLDPVF